MSGQANSVFSLVETYVCHVCRLQRMCALPCPSQALVLKPSARQAKYNKATALRCLGRSHHAPHACRLGGFGASDMTRIFRHEEALQWTQREVEKVREKFPRLYALNQGPGRARKRGGPTSRSFADANMYECMCAGNRCICRLDLAPACPALACCSRHQY